MPPTVTVAAFVIGIVLLLAALVGKELEVATVKLPALNRGTRFIAGAAGAVLVYIGLFNPLPPQSDVGATADTAPMDVAPQITATPTTLTATATPSAQSSASGSALESATTIQDLEPLLKAANVLLSAGDDAAVAQVRTYFSGPQSAYHMLAVATLKVVGDNRRFKQPVHLDIVDKWYTQQVGSGYASRGPLDLEKVKLALLQAHNDFYGDNATTLDALLEQR